MPADYSARAAQYGFATPEEVRALLAQADTLILDTRTKDEMQDAGSVDRAIQTNCTATECPQLSLAPDSVIPDKTANVVIYCRSGRRASRAKEILLEKGYTGTILNAGGYDDMVCIQKNQ